MNCYDCAAHGETTVALAVCADCGAGLCSRHAHLVPRWLTRTMVINRVVAIEPPARTIRCGICQAARDAAEADTSHGRPVPARGANRLTARAQGARAFRASEGHPGDLRPR